MGTVVGGGVVAGDRSDGDGERGLCGVDDLEAGVGEVRGPAAEKLGLRGELVEVEVAGRDDEQQAVAADGGVERRGQRTGLAADVRAGGVAEAQVDDAALVLLDEVTDRVCDQPDGVGVLGLVALVVEDPDGRQPEGRLEAAGPRGGKDVAVQDQPGERGAVPVLVVGATVEGAVQRLRRKEGRLEQRVS